MKIQNEHGSFKYTVVVAVGKLQTDKSEFSTAEKTSKLHRQTSETKTTTTITEETIVGSDAMTTSTTESDVRTSTTGAHDIQVKNKGEAKKDTLPKQRKPWEDYTTSESEASSAEEGEPPKFVTPPEPLYIDVGENIKLTCKVTGWILS